MTGAAEVAALLDEFHAAAAAADEARYLEALAPDAVFLGTAPGERWVGKSFREFVHSYFSRGIGWEYRASDRSIDVAGDGETAWFDERLENDSYGECRGTGVARRHEGAWKLEQYSLSVPIPDELAGEVVAAIRNRRSSA